MFDIEVDERDPDRLVEIVASLAPTFGGINLEDIKAPECFEIEHNLKERLDIPVFHDDQHGTAIIVAAAVLNGLRVVGKRIEEASLVTAGAGAAALACLDLLLRLGLRRDNVVCTDIAGVVYEGRRDEMDPYKARYAVRTDARTLAEAIEGADVFLGLSAPGVLEPEMVARMAERPLILALANPVPEILPDAARAVRPDAVIATGRSDYPNQVNNVLCFPYIFRGALDVGATTINDEMKIACVHALARLAMAEQTEIGVKAYGGATTRFGPEYIIPKPFDPRLIMELAPAVATAAMESGVASHPLADIGAYRQRLTEFVFRSGFVMKPIIDRAKADPKRLVFAEGEDRRVLRTVQQLVNEGLAKPIIVGRPGVAAKRIDELGLSIRAGRDFDLVNPQRDRRFREYWSEYHQIMGRKGVSPADAQTVVRTQNTVIAALMVRRGEADAMLCGTQGAYRDHLRHVVDVIGLAPGVAAVSALTALVLPSGTFFVCDTHVTPHPSVEEIVEMTVLSAQEVRRFGITPKVALLSHSNFGTRDDPPAVKMRDALALLHARAPELEAEGEMHADAALSAQIREITYPQSRLQGSANLLIMPDIDAAHISYNLLKMLGGGVSIGPMLVGAARPAHVVTTSITVRGLVNMAAIAVTEAHTQSAPLCD